MRSLQAAYVSAVQSEFAAQPLKTAEIIDESHIAHLPAPVRTYLAYTGAVGRSRPQNYRLAFAAKMTQRPGGPAMDAVSEQYNFLGNLARIFFMKASMFIIPFRVLHTYRDRQATMVVRVASLFNAVDIAGEELSIAETVTVLNDMCLFAPGSLIDQRLQWKEIDSQSAHVTFTNGPYTVSAILHFNEEGALVNFISEDRSALQDDGSLRKMRWSTPVRDYKVVDGRRIPTYGETIYHYPEGNFSYGAFSLRDIQYNIGR